MSTHITGFRPADEKWNEMKAAWLACENAGVIIPTKVVDFFDGEHPGDKPGAEVSIDAALQDWRDDYREGYEVDLTKLPLDVKVLRLYNSY